MGSKTKIELENEVAELKRLIKELQASANNTVSTPKVVETSVTPTIVTAPSTDVVVVYTSHSLGHLQGTQFAIDASVFGEEFTLSRSQFDELAGKYREWFKDGRLAVSYKNVEVAAIKDLPTDRDLNLTVTDLRNLGSMTTTQIEELWNKVRTDSLRMSIVTYFKEQFEENVPGFRDRARIDCLNRLTDGGFDSESRALGGRPYKIQPTDLIMATED